MILIILWAAGGALIKPQSVPIKTACKARRQHLATRTQTTSSRCFLGFAGTHIQSSRRYAICLKGISKVDIPAFELNHEYSHIHD